MNKKTIALLLIVCIPLLALAFPNLGRKSPSYYDLPDGYVIFPPDSKFNFKNFNINYSYFYQYGLDLERMIAPLSQGKDGVLEGETLFATSSALAIPVYDKKNIRYLGSNNNGQHVYETNVYLHISVYVSYSLYYFDEKKEYFIDLGKSTLFTLIPPETYKTIAPQLEIE